MDGSIIILVVVALLFVALMYGVYKLIGRTIQYLEVKTTYYKMLIEKEHFK